MASEDDRNLTCMSCFGFCTKPKKHRRMFFPPVSDEDLLQPVSPVDEPVHGGSVYLVATQFQGEENDEKPDEIMRETERHSSAIDLCLDSGDEDRKKKQISPDVKKALEEYEKLAMQKSLERIEKENQGSSSNPKTPEPGGSTR